MLAPRYASRSYVRRPRQEVRQRHHVLISRRRTSLHGQRLQRVDDPPPNPTLNSRRRRASAATTAHAPRRHTAVIRVYRRPRRSHQPARSPPYVCGSSPAAFFCSPEAPLPPLRLLRCCCAVPRASCPIKIIRRRVACHPGRSPLEAADGES